MRWNFPKYSRLYRVTKKSVQFLSPLPYPLPFTHLIVVGILSDNVLTSILNYCPERAFQSSNTDCRTSSPILDSSANTAEKLLLISECLSLKTLFQCPKEKNHSVRYPKSMVLWNLFQAELVRDSRGKGRFVWSGIVPMKEHAKKAMHWPRFTNGCLELV